MPEFGDDIDDEISDTLNKHGTWLQNYKKSFSIKKKADDPTVKGVELNPDGSIKKSDNTAGIDGPADTMQGDPALYDPNLSLIHI